ncbi:MAG: 16S rRNA (adenine(1518)-N(6)/adenine(1519)-N(6))-dimethyltransferase RsmA [Pseudohongiellaceae bacterium]
MRDDLPLQARKRFGQNFLHDAGVIERIVDIINPQTDEHLLEIGPGRGALTDLLSNSGASLDCVELDRDLADHLQQKFSNHSNVRVMQQDILKFDLTSLSTSNATHRLRVIGNLPYNISTPVLFHLLHNHHLIQDMVFMLQLEVVQRMTADIGTKQYGRLGLMLRYYCAVEHLFNVPAAAFSPRPKVMSAMVRLVPHRPLPCPATTPKLLATVIRTAFNQRRKTLKNSLKTIIPETLLSTIPVDFSQRPEQLPLADYVLISNMLAADEA